VNHLRKNYLLPIDFNQESLNSVFMAFKPYFKPSTIQGIGEDVVDGVELSSIDGVVRCRLGMVNCRFDSY